jgi:thioredoxin-related protein
MEKSIMLLLLLSGMLFCGETVWQKSLSDAFSVAEKEHKVVMVMVEGTHCRWCKKMRSQTLSSEKAIQALSAFVNVRVNESDPSAMKVLPPLKGVPTIFFLYPDKRVIEHVEGYYSVEDFLSFIKDVRRKTWQVN